MSTHAKLSPSSAARWIGCPGSVTLSKDIPNTTSVYAEEGTKAHAEAAECLTQNLDVGNEYVMVYVDAIRRASEGKVLLVEQPIEIGHITTEKGSRGTADAIIFDFDSGVLEVHDLKYGQGHMVYAEGNEQLQMYALGAMKVVAELLGAVVTSVKLVIHQPRRDHLSETEITVQKLLEFGNKAKAAGLTALSALAGMEEPTLRPSDKACMWCPAKTVCPALTEAVHQAVQEDFLNPDKGDSLVPSADFLNMVEGWVKSMHKAIFERLQNQIPTPGWKLVQGKRGNRKWVSEKLTLELLKRFGYKKAKTHETSLLPLTKLEKLVTAEQWPAFEANITQPDGAPTAVSDTDPRPELVTAVATDFDLFQ